jgi:Glyoxalase-like domain
MIPRRRFVALSGTVLFATRFAYSSDETPPMLDHILLGSNDLDDGIAFVEKQTGVRAAFGGVHPGMGTRNALLSLGVRRYLEVIAPDPKQENVDAQRLNSLKKLKAPKLVGWAAHLGNADEFVKRVRDQGIGIGGPFPGSRVRPDGRVLRWKTAALNDDSGGLIPFFIEWDKDSVHPSSDAPSGCSLESFSVAAFDPERLTKIFRQLGIEVAVERSEKPELRARIAGPKGVMQLSF